MQNENNQPSPVDETRHAIAVGERYQAHSGAIFIPRMIDTLCRVISFKSSDDETVRMCSFKWWNSHVYPHTTLAAAKPVDDLGELERLAKEATPGERTFYVDDEGNESLGIGRHPAGSHQTIWYSDGTTPEMITADGRFIAACSPDRIQGLIHRLREAEGLTVRMARQNVIDCARLDAAEQSLTKLNKIKSETPTSNE